MLADLWEVDGAAGATGEYVSPHARLFVVLNSAEEGTIALSDCMGSASSATGRLSYIPPGLRTWSNAARETRLRHLDLHVDLAHLAPRFGLGPDEACFTQPRLMFENERILALARLLADECAEPSRHDLYCDGIATAMLAELFAIGPRPQDRRGHLSPRRLRLATQYLSDRCYQTIRLEEAARLVDLSPSYFSAAFKLSTGLTPHQWQMQLRIERIKTMLAKGAVSLSEAADAAGFADQAHMTRVFKRHAGMTPAAWLRDNGPVRHR